MLINVFIVILILKVEILSVEVMFIVFGKYCFVNCMIYNCKLDIFIKVKNFINIIVINLKIVLVDVNWSNNNVIFCKLNIMNSVLVGCLFVKCLLIVFLIVIIILYIISKIIIMFVE